MPRIVDADPDRNDRNDRNITVNERITQGNPIAEILKTIPLFVWAAPGWILAGLICLAIGKYGINGFTNALFSWLSIVPWIIGVVSIIKGILWAHNTFDMVMTKYHNRRLLASNVRKVDQSVLALEKKNRLLDAELAIALQIAGSIDKLVDKGSAFKYAKGTLDVLGQPNHTLISPVPNQQGQIGAGPAPLALGPASSLPDAVNYEDIQEQVPAGHSLMGVSSDAVETTEFGNLMTMWICGGSGGGKSNTVGIKIEEAIENGRNLGILCIDYHANKKDSLYNKIKEYEDLFLMPVARDEKEAMAVLERFYGEFGRRRTVPEEEQDQLSDVLLVVDEVPAVVEDETIAPLLKKIARLCGRESRGFGMFGWFISQNAVGLAWLRNVALTVIAHKMVMLNDAELACNQHKDIARDMENWPIGRVVVYGMRFKGIKVLQMPFKGGRLSRVVDSSNNESEEVTLVDAVDVQPGDDRAQEEQTTSNVIPALSGDLRTVYEACQQLQAANERISTRAIERLTKIDKDKANGLLHRLAAMGYIPPRTKAV
jgi:hypothetical protein